MRIVILTPWPPLQDGLSYYSWFLCNALASMSEIVVIASNLSFSTSKGKLKVVASWPLGTTGVTRAIKSCLRNSADVFHIEAPPMFLKSTLGMILLPFTIAALRSSGKPVIVTLHTVIDMSNRRQSTYQPDNTLQKLFNVSLFLSQMFLIAYTRSVCLLSTKVIVLSDLMRKILLSRYSVSPKKVIVIPHGVKKRMTSGSFRDNCSQIRELLFLGFIRPSKGLEILIDAFSNIADRLPNVKLVIAGGAAHPKDKDYLNSLKKMILHSRHYDKIHVIGRSLSDEEIASLIERAYAIVLPYLDNFIEVSGVVANVMDYGKPIICTRTPRFLGDLSPNIDCLMVEPGDVRGLSNAIQTILERKDLVEMMKRNLEAKARTRYWERIAEEHLKVYAMK